jgi:hypothetical protein
MRIDRRDFLKLAAAAGLTVAGPSLASRTAHASGPYAGPFWVTIHASGGWDPTLLCDPKGRVSEDDEQPINSYFNDQIGTAGAFRFAPVDGHADFFERHRERLLVLNGIDMGTNSHDTGTRAMWSGGTANEMPALAAIVAATRTQTPPLAFLTNGGYERTAQLVAPTRIPNVDAIQEIAYPHRLSGGDPDSSLFTDTTQARIAAARLARLERQTERATLPRHRAALSTLYTARASENELVALSDYLPSELDSTNNPLRRQAQVAVAGFKAGLTVSANLVIGGFDTHGNHDSSHTPRMQMVLQGVDFLLEEAERQGIADQIVLIVGSDFARTPWYNEGNGKDHWSVTSMMMMGPGIRGGRVIGATNERQEPIGVDPSTLATAAGGVTLTPGIVHGALRRLAEVDSHPSVAPFGVEETPLNLLA